jgi:glycosyltransferase involved in cell wall biosynthesis
LGSGLGSRNDFTLCTIAARNYLASVSLLVESFRVHHPSAPVTVLVVDGDETDTFDDLPYEVLFPVSLPLQPEILGQMATYYDVTEFSTALKPFVLEVLVARGDGVVIYLDPDIEVFAPLDALVEETEREHIVLTPHVTRPVPRDGLGFAEESLLLSGQFNLGFIGVAPGADSFLDYWKERTRLYALRDVERGYFTDQRWVDAVPALFPHAVCFDPGCNVAYWNLHERRLGHEAETWTVNDRPLKFFHFSGHRADAPFVLSAHLHGRTRVSVEADDALRTLLVERAQRMTKAQERFPSCTYRFQRTDDGLPLTDLLRRYYWHAVVDAEAAHTEPPPHGFGRDGGAALTRWFAAACAPGHPVTRHVLALWEQRSDLRHAFPELGGPDGERLADWSAVDEAFLADTPAVLQPHTAARLPGVNLVGYLRGEFGVGAAARLLASALRASGLPVATTVIRPPEHRHQAAFLETGAGSPYTLSLLALNADALLDLVDRGHLVDHQGLPKVGIWYWEAGALPPALRRAFSHVDEVWCATDHIRDLLCSSNPDVSVRVHPLSFGMPSRTALDREDVGLPTDRFVFGCSFDYSSVTRRKNPIGVIDAYRRAFGPDDGAALVLKTVHAARFGCDAAAVAEAAAGRTDILVANRHFDQIEMDAFFQHLDAFVSLHRSEGLGLNLASAMAAGVPVVATGWSGNLQFMSEDDSRLVPYELVEVGPGAEPYAADAWWAEPDVDRAAGFMRELFDDPEGARQLGGRGREAIVQRSDRPRAGEWYVDRFELLTGSAIR